MFPFFYPSSKCFACKKSLISYLVVVVYVKYLSLNIKDSIYLMKKYVIVSSKMVLFIVLKYFM
jgi:hypothetical protein